MPKADTQSTTRARKAKIPTKQASSAGDGALLALANEGLALAEALKTANADREVTERRYLAILPPLPSELRWQKGDPTISVRGADGEEACDTRDLDWLRGVLPGLPEPLKTRATVIIETHDRHSAACEAIAVAVGFRAAEQRQNELFRRYTALLEQAMAMPATTLMGLITKAKFLASFTEGELPDPAMDDTDMARLIVRDLLAMT
ncbi:hypothetical protein [Rhodoplanes sp. SY1]|uniref:hypothetical protein n=1 Tax=Rhodoplanes sp. SY1 TaxID=3166646 RepID=UPI0038B52CBD